MLDDYESVRARERVDAAASLMAEALVLTGHSGLDAAYAGLAYWLADRDGWQAPQWALADERVARPWWFVSSSAYGRAPAGGIRFPHLRALSSADEAIVVSAR